LPVYEISENNKIEKYAKTFDQIKKHKAVEPLQSDRNYNHDIYYFGDDGYLTCSSGTNNEEEKELQDEIRQSVATTRIKKRTIMNFKKVGTKDATDKEIKT
jgi:hypothetical protein